MLGRGSISKRDNNFTRASCLSTEKASSEQHNLTGHKDDNCHLLSDHELLHVYELRAPCSLVRFARLRMAIRVILRANIETLVLIHFAGSDPGSWLHALLEDLVWLSSCLPDAKYTFTDWCHFVRCSPKKARCLVRKACSSDTARSLTIAEGNKDVAALVSSHTCFWSCVSIKGGTRWAQRCTSRSD